MCTQRHFFAEHADDAMAEKFTIGAEEGGEQMETAEEGQNGDHTGEGEEEVRTGCGLQSVRHSSSY